MTGNDPFDGQGPQLWSQVTAGLIRAGAWDCLDTEALAAVIEHLGTQGGGPDVAANRALYAQDLARWGQATAALLRAGHREQVDLDAVAEELESLRKGEAHRLMNHLQDLLVWFLAWNYAPAQREPHAYWYVRIVEARTQIEIACDVSPSLRATLAEDLPQVYPQAREAASEETDLPLEAFPETCPWPVTQVVRQRGL